MQALSRSSQVQSEHELEFAQNCWAVLAQSRPATARGEQYFRRPWMRTPSAGMQKEIKLKNYSAYLF